MSMMTAVSTKTPLSRVPDVLRVAYEADLPVLLEGPHGIGKSTIFEAVAGEMGIEVRVLDLSLMEPVDLLGIPHLADGQTVYAAPARLPRAGKGLLLLEELNRAAPQTRAPALELLTRRELHDYSLPPSLPPSRLAAVRVHQPQRRRVRCGRPGSGAAL